MGLFAGRRAIGRQQPGELLPRPDGAQARPIRVEPRDPARSQDGHPNRVLQLRQHGTGDGQRGESARLEQILSVGSTVYITHSAVAFRCRC